MNSNFQWDPVWLWGRVERSEGLKGSSVRGQEEMAQEAPSGKNTRQTEKKMRSHISQLSVMAEAPTGTTTTTTALPMPLSVPAPPEAHLKLT